MKHFLSLIIILLTHTASNAQSNNWKLVNVRNNDNVVVGHIYHTEAIGHQVGAFPEKAPTGLRLVCSSYGNDEPLLILYWAGMYGNIPEKVSIQVDNRQIGVGQTYLWKHDGTALYRTVAESGEILRAMKVGRSIKLSWTGSNRIQRTTMFDLGTFNQNIRDFNTACNTNI